MINELALMRRMEQTYKKGGYKVGTYIMGGREILAVAGADWYVTLFAAEASNALRGLIVRHTGALPGKPVLAWKEGVQMMMAGELEKQRLDALPPAETAENCAPTPLMLEEWAVWQGESGRCYLLDAGSTGSFMTGDDSPSFQTDGRVLHMDGESGEVLVGCIKANGALAKHLDHLGRFAWNALACPEA